MSSQKAATVVPVAWSDDDIIDARCMRAAIDESRMAVHTGHMPFGAVIADRNGTILVRGHNLCMTTTTTNGAAATQQQQRGGSTVNGADPTKHAEMEVVRRACMMIDATIRSTCTLYTSTEPCVMCAGAIYWSRIGRIVYGCSSEELAKYTGPGGFDIPIHTIFTLGRPGTRQLEIHGPYLNDEAMKVHIESGVWGNAPGNADVEEENTMKSDLTDDTDVVDTLALKDIAIEASLFTSGLGSAAASNDLIVPVIDMSIGTEEDIAIAVWNAATTVGFFTLINHGISSELIDTVFDVSSQFFAQTQTDKEQQSPYARNLNSGYEYMKQLRPSTGTVDQKESIQITARCNSMEHRWPSTPKNFRSVTETFMTQVHALAGRLLDLLESRATPNVAPGTVSSSHTLWGPEGQCTLRMLHYPPILDVETLRTLTTPDEHGRIAWRAGPHTDWSNVTLLFQRVGQAGLECCSNPQQHQQSERRWTPVDPIENGIAVNIGDMLARWSDHRLYSNLHRVRMPSEMECGTSRYSIAYFAQSDQSTILQSTSTVDPPMTAGDYLLSRIQSNFVNTPTSNATKLS